MTSIRRQGTRGWGRSNLLLSSVLALLALACFPVLAQAGSGTIEYDPTLPGDGGAKQNENIAKTSETPPSGGAEAPGRHRRRAKVIRKKLLHRMKVGARLLRATAAARARVTQTRAITRPLRQRCRTTPRSRRLPPRLHFLRRRRVLAPRPDPDRRPGARGDLDRRGDDPPAAPAGRRRPLRSPRRPASPCPRPAGASGGGHVRGPSRSRSCTSAALSGSIGAAARRRRAGQLLGRRPAGDAERRTVPAPEAGGRRQRPRADRLGRRAVQPGGAFNWNGTDAMVGGAAGAGIEVLPFVTGAPTWAVRSAVVHKAARAMAPLNLPVRTGAQKAGWKTFLTRSGQALRPERRLLGRQPGDPLQADPRLAALERAELQILRRPAQPGRVRQAGQDLAPGDQGHRPGRQDRPRRALRGAQGSDLQIEAAAGLLRHRLHRTALQEDARASSPGSTASPCTPTPTTTRTSPATSKNCATCSRPPTTRASRALDHRARLERRPAQRQQRIQRLREGAERPGEAAQGVLPAARGQPAEMERSSSSTGSRSTTNRAPATSATAPASSAQASSPGRPGSVRQVRRRRAG